VVDYRLSADGTAVVYRADQEVPGVVELYASRCSGTRAASQH
jgi:hypothetical protein